MAENTGAHVAQGADPGDPYAVQSGYLPEPGPQGLPHLPPVGTETAQPPKDSHGPGLAEYAGTEEFKEETPKPSTKKTVKKEDK